MFRVHFPTLAGTICALLLSFVLLLPAASANAGQYKPKSSGSGHVSYAGSTENFSGQRTFRRTGKRHKYSTHRYGKRIGGHRHQATVNRSHGKHRGHYGRRGGFGDIAIVIGATATGAGDPANSASSVVLENGRCAAGEYCTLRLGPFSNSPKIITLNGSGRTIAEGLLD